MGSTGPYNPLFVRVPKALFDAWVSGFSIADLALAIATIVTGVLMLATVYQYQEAYATVGGARSRSGLASWTDRLDMVVLLRIHLAAAILFWVSRIILFYYILVDYVDWLDQMPPHLGLAMLFLFMVAAILLIFAFALGVVAHHGVTKLPARTTLILRKVHIWMGIGATLMAYVALFPVTGW